MKEVEKAFKTTCKALLGEDIGEMDGYEKFLWRYVAIPSTRKSSDAKSDVFLSGPYGNHARIFSNAEAQKRMAAPLSINDIKDIDSLLEAAQQRFEYAGDKVLGKSMGVERSDACIDAVFVTSSQNILESEYIGYCDMVGESKFMFGCSFGTQSTHCMNVTEFYNANRVLESGVILFSSDCFYCYNCKNASNLMFCFNQYSKRHCIGNNQFMPDKFTSMKKKISSEIIEMLRKKKSIPSLVEFANGAV